MHKNWIHNIRVWCLATFGLFGLFIFLIGLVLLIPGGLVVAGGLLVEWKYDKIVGGDHVDS